MSIDNSQKFSSFATLKAFSELLNQEQPTVDQVKDAIEALCRFYGAENEEELLSKADEELKKIYLGVKNEILKTVKSTEGDHIEQQEFKNQ
ncbi:hypothetical protein LOZ80_14450 [Paenibacillus sp. HWE-109]|uniref:hypothetical protein n=1 Tax=Paenibacillus sp. HWE-109 TaxID=1306526 RepID=UPI001EDCF9B3|nr:hypothetical protein [Paenibacillus sp. HWE-109]UKS30064.1 hypothetical protein LOZ80_14450 [Paenibacillus sp. HWE-109]